MSNDNFIFDPEEETGGAAGSTVSQPGRNDSGDETFGIDSANASGDGFNGGASGFDDAAEDGSQRAAGFDTDEEYAGDEDEDDITIADKNAPVVMLFGPISSGKSMTLVRLSSWLHDNGYTVKPDKTFKSGRKYSERCDKFLRQLDTKTALSGTALNEFLLVKIIKDGRTVCQILEAPGEHYFNKDDVSVSNFPPYMTRIIKTLPNRKLWVFITEAEWDVNNSVKKAYIRRIRNCKAQLIKPSDRYIILYNKVDRRDEVFKDGQIMGAAAERLMKEEYDGLAGVFANSNPITSLWRKYDYKFVPFSTGTFAKGTNKYTESEDFYPRIFWNTLVECIKG